MNPLITQLARETEELGFKLHRLENFVHTEKFEGLPDEHRRLLSIQVSVMKTYLQILVSRLDLFLSKNSRNIL